VYPGTDQGWTDSFFREWVFGLRSGSGWTHACAGLPQLSLWPSVAYDKLLELWDHPIRPLLLQARCPCDLGSPPLPLATVPVHVPDQVLSVIIMRRAQDDSLTTLADLPPRLFHQANLAAARLVDQANAAVNFARLGAALHQSGVADRPFPPLNHPACRVGQGQFVLPSCFHAPTESTNKGHGDLPTTSRSEWELLRVFLTCNVPADTASHILRLLQTPGFNTADVHMKTFASLVKCLDQRAGCTLKSENLGIPMDGEQLVVFHWRCPRQAVLEILQDNMIPDTQTRVCVPNATCRRCTYRVKFHSNHFTQNDQCDISNFILNATCRHCTAHAGSEINHSIA